MLKIMDILLCFLYTFCKITQSSKKFLCFIQFYDMLSWYERFCTYKTEKSLLFLRNERATCPKGGVTEHEQIRIGVGIESRT